MSAPELPEDPRDWPADPFALLGVRPGAGETDIKRAYTRLIRRFKPEHAPEQFRRIREAYEACLVRTRWYAPPPEAFPDLTPPETTPPAPAEKPEPAPDRGEAAPEPPQPELVPPPPADELDRLWSAATEGRDAEAYVGLADLAALRRDRPDVPLRLYWLLALNPALDADRTRHHWLADALTRSRLAGPAAELYRRELEASPMAGLSGSYLGLLAVDAEARDLLTLARRRLLAAGRIRGSHVAQADLEAVRDRLLARHEAEWLGLLVSALDWAAWDRLEPLCGFCRAELAKLRHLELSHAGLFDRVDETAHVAADWWQARFQIPEPLFRLLPLAWAGDDPDPADVGPAVAAVAADPMANVGRFDRVIREQGPGLVGLLARVLDRHRRLQGVDEPGLPAETVRGLLRGVADPARFPNYSFVRADLLGFLTAEALDPLELADACADDPDARVRELAPMLRQDVSLRLVWLAARLHLG